MSELPPNEDMLEGFRDGYDLTAPEPSSNRSASYRHGFMCGRLDKGLIKRNGRTADDLRQLADLAMAKDYCADIQIAGAK